MYFSQSNKEAKLSAVWDHFIIEDDIEMLRCNIKDQWQHIVQCHINNYNYIYYTAHKNIIFFIID